ncbi:MAG: hypothetical protein L0227_20035 [Chloroflexi bacterium]|nr:hypothetical protein [Chloroflexota bacterium]
MTADVGRLLGEEALGDASGRLLAAVAPLRVVVGWATVELDRAEEEVGAILAGRDGARAPRVEAAIEDRLLGARCRRLRTADELDVLLLEPSTEGRLAAALARHGEGFLARYHVVDPGASERARRAGFVLSSVGRGPLGPERLVIHGPRWGPFLLLVAE